MVSPSRHGGPQARVSSPPSGRSTLMTSAPRSPSSIAASGPASTREKSATRIPSSGGMAGQTRRAMRTLVISDLHLGKAEGNDLLRRADLREPLLEALDGVDRLVILGDGLELREAAHRDAVEIATPFFAEIGRVLGADRELIVLSGNHDHGLAAGWIDARLQSEPVGFLGLEQRFPPADAGPLARRLAEAAQPARVELAYPGSGCATTSTRSTGITPTSTPPSRRSSGSPPGRWPAGSARLPERGATPDDYEAVLSPLYAWLHALTQRSGHTLISKGGGASSRSYRALTSGRSPRSLALHTGYRAAVAALNAPGSARCSRACRRRRCAAATCRASARCSRGSTCMPGT